MAATVSLTVHLRDGSSQTISSQLGGNGCETVRYNQLIKSLTSVQDQANDILTTLVNQEKAEKNRICTTSSSLSKCSENSSDGVANSNGELETNNGTTGSESDSTDDEEEDDITDKPPEKKRKT